MSDMSSLMMEANLKPIAKDQVFKENYTELKMTGCNHNNVRCLNHYDKFRKYLCDCWGKVYICECEREMASKLFPHQTKFGAEFGTSRRLKVNGYAKVCSKCKGEKLEPHPKAQVYNLKKKLDRYYWREISFTYYQKILDFINKNNIAIADIFEYEDKYPDFSKKFKKEARDVWRQIHKVNPLYEYNTVKQDDFIKKNNVEVIEIIGCKGDNNGWLDQEGNELSSEDFVANYYRTQGYETYSCERKIVSTLVGTFLWTPINDPIDDNLEMRGIGPRGEYSKTPASDFSNGVLWFQLPTDFGSKEYFIRRKDAFEEWLNILMKSEALIDELDYFLKISYRLRDYLWVHNDDAENITRKFLEIVPDRITLKAIRWAIEHFWDRQPGWPDLFVVKGDQYFFVEVKGPNDKLSPSQMDWFEWALGDGIFPCCLCKLKTRKEP